MSNETKDRLLGQSFGSASNRLRKTILYSMLYGKVYDRNCFRCGEPIVDVDDMSIEHRKPWQSADDPKAAFFDLKNIAFSHLRCNSAASCGPAVSADQRRLLPEVKRSNKRLRDARWAKTAKGRESRRDYQRNRYATDPAFAEYHRQRNRA